MKIINNIHYFLIISLIVLSCIPEAGPHSPSEYELEISISSDKYPAVSPDGNLIAYFHQSLEYPEPTDYPTGLYVMNSDGTNRRLMLKGRHFNPSWSPDDQWLVFTSEGVIRIINLEGTILRTFEGVNDVPLYFPDWSPDGKIILMNSPYVNGGGVFFSNPMFENVRHVLNSEIFSGFSARWTNDMANLIYEKVSQQWHAGEIFFIDTLGTNDTRITNDDYDDRNPVLSKDSKKIVWSRNVQIMVMNVDGSIKKELDFGQYPSWSPGSDFVVYSNANHDVTKEVIWRIDINGNNKTQLTY